MTRKQAISTFLQRIGDLRFHFPCGDRKAGHRNSCSQSGRFSSSVANTVVCISLMKRLHDWVRPRHEQLIERYVEIMGRIAALVVGTYSIEMILSGLSSWVGRLGANSDDSFQSPTRI